MKKRTRFNKIFPYLFLPAGIVLFLTASLSPYWVEKIYSEGIYSVISNILCFIINLLPFSLAGFVIIAVISLILYIIVRTVIVLFHSRKRKKSILLGLLSKIVITVGIVYFAFVVLWGLNYQRLPFSRIANLDVKPSSVHELYNVCSSIIDNTNKLRSTIEEDSEGFVCIKGGYSSVFDRAKTGYDKISSVYPQLGGNIGKPKPFFPSIFMCYAGISGVYFPFTGEANVNIDMPQSFLPACACHEMAHQRGFAREDEANFISYLACSAHPDNDFKYSGDLLALVNSMNALYNADRGRYKVLIGKYSAGVTRDLDENDRFWDSFKGPVQDISEKINDTYLKANMQTDGIYSYGRMVDLLIAEYRRGNL